MTRQGNKDRMTFNYGHDVAKTRLSSKLQGNGFDIYEIRKDILNHTEIKSLLEKQSIKIGKICGQNFVIGAKSELLSVYRKVNAINNSISTFISSENYYQMIKVYITKLDNYANDGEEELICNDENDNKYKCKTPKVDNSKKGPPMVE